MQVRNSIRNALAFASTGLLSIAAMAQTVDPFTGALTDATTKVNTYAAGLVTLAVVGVGFGIAVKYVKKLKGAA